MYGAQISASSFYHPANFPGGDSAVNPGRLSQTLVIDLALPTALQSIGERHVHVNRHEEGETLMSRRHFHQSKLLATLCILALSASMLTITNVPATGATLAAPSCALFVSGPTAFGEFFVGGGARIACDRDVNTIHVKFWLTKDYDVRPNSVSSQNCYGDHECDTEGSSGYGNGKGWWHAWGDGFVLFGPDRTRRNFATKRSECKYLRPLSIMCPFSYE